MKRYCIMLVAMLLISSLSIAGNEGKETATIHWTGKKVTGQHEGTVDFSEVTWKFDPQGGLLAANFVVDMTSIAVTDLEGKSKNDLEGHLNSEDFFHTSEYPTAQFRSSSIRSLGDSKYQLTGILSIKGIEQEISFQAEVSYDGHMHTAKANINIDRTKYDIRYGSGKFFDNLGDRMIDDEFSLSILIRKH